MTRIRKMRGEIVFERSNYEVLSRRERFIYENIPGGEVDITDIKKELGMTREKLYTPLKHLVQKGFLTVRKLNGVNHYRKVNIERELAYEYPNIT